MRHRQGITLILVLLILTALMLLGVPFVASMLFKEKISKDTLNLTQSRIATLGARNSAINLLLRTHDAYELQPYPAPFDTPDYDTPEEFQINLALTGITNTANPKGAIWSSYAEDEQGKINILTAPSRVVELLKTLIKPNEDIRHFITQHSYRSTPWIAAQNLAGYNRYQAIDGNEYDIIYVNNQVPYSNEEGLRVRLQNGLEEIIAYTAREPCPLCKVIKPFPDNIKGDSGRHRPYPYGWIVSMEDPVLWRTGGTIPLWLDRAISDTFLVETTTVEIEQPHPVNINTAPKEVLLALFTGVGNTGYLPPDWLIPYNNTIDQNQASEIVDEIKKQPVTGFMDLEAIITNTALADTQKNNLLLNALYPRADQLFNILSRYFTGTMPFCYRSFDTYTLNSTGIINYPSGNQASAAYISEIVDIAPITETLVWRIESQYEFNKEFYTHLGNPSKLTTYPILTNLGGWDSTSAGKNPDYSRDPDMGALKLKTAEDNRGSQRLGPTYSFSDKYDGMAAPIEFPAVSAVRTTTLDITSGGAEFWVKFDNLPFSASIFDIKQGNYENRLALLYENGELILSVCDATIERKAAQIRAPFSFEPGIWYHLGAYWKGTKYAQLALLVDGRPVGAFGHYDDIGNKILTRLSSNLPDLSGMDAGKTEMLIPVISTDGFPDAGVIEIGSEAIDYISKTLNAFTVQTVWEPLTPTQLAFSGRGRRNTSIISHTAGATISIYGYSTPFTPTINIINYPTININPLPIGGATLQETIPQEIPTITLDIPGGLSASATTIPISCSDTSKLPAQGYIKINSEAIFYENISGDSLRNCERGALGTVPSNHADQSQVRIFSIRVSSTDNYPDTTLIQINDEWFGPLQKSPDRPEFFTGSLSGAQPLELWRGYVSSPTTHYVNTPIIPVLAPAKIVVGKNDLVSIVESDQAGAPKEQKLVKNAITRNQEPVFLFTGNSPGFYYSVGTNTSNIFAFSENLSRSYNIDGVTRMLKFPSDELPSYLPGTFTIGANISAAVDEVKFYSSPRGDYFIAETVTASDLFKNTVRFNAPSLNSSGLIKIGDEYIGYGSITGTTLLNCVRGYLNSPIQTIEAGQRAINLTAFMPVTSLTQNITDYSYNIPVNSSAGFDNSGYVLIGNNFESGEVAGYTRLIQMPAHSDGIFRGMFGTPKQNHPANTLCYGIPFRYWDLQKPNAFDSAMAYFQAAHLLRGATWKRISWEETHLPGNDGLTRLRILVRFDNQPAWNTAPKNQPGGIFEFTAPDGLNELNVKSDQIEIMVFFQYLPGALLSNAWKRSPLLENIFVEYAKPPAIILSRQEK